MSLQENLQDIQENILAACNKAGRSREEVRLVAVSKTKPATMIQELYAMGVRDFGENRVMELIQKAELLPKDISWHLIGHLQTNKVKMILPKIERIDSLDSLRLARCVDEEARKQNRVVSALLEINMAKEESKFGFFEEEVFEALAEISKMKSIQVQGLMTVAPFVEDAESNRDIFRRMKKLSVDIMKKNIDNVHMDCLSMGMSIDYEVAIEEGATEVRVGSNLFGKR